MPRRASSKSHPAGLFLVLLLAAGALAGGVYFWTQLSDPYRTLAPMDVAAYLEDANSLRGNVYKLDASVDSQLAWTPGQGRLYSVLPHGSANDLLPILVPPAFDRTNLVKDQRFLFKVEVGENGVLKVDDMRKI